MIMQSNHKGRKHHSMEQGWLRMLLMTQIILRQNKYAGERTQYSLKVYSEVYYRCTTEYNTVEKRQQKIFKEVGCSHKIFHLQVNNR